MTGIGEVEGVKDVGDMQGVSVGVGPPTLAASYYQLGALEEGKLHLCNQRRCQGGRMVHGVLPFT